MAKEKIRELVRLLAEIANDKNFVTNAMMIALGIGAEEYLLGKIEAGDIEDKTDVYCLLNSMGG